MLGLSRQNPHYLRTQTLRSARNIIRTIFKTVIGIWIIVVVIIAVSSYQSDIDPSRILGQHAPIIQPPSSDQYDGTTYRRMPDSPLGPNSSLAPPDAVVAALETLHFKAEAIPTKKEINDSEMTIVKDLKKRKDEIKEQWQLEDIFDTVRAIEEQILTVKSKAMLLLRHFHPKLAAQAYLCPERNDSNEAKTYAEVDKAIKKAVDSKNVGEGNTAISLAQHGIILEGDFRIKEAEGKLKEFKPYMMSSNIVANNNANKVTPEDVARFRKQALSANEKQFEIQELLQPFNDGKPVSMSESDIKRLRNKIAADAFLNAITLMDDLQQQIRRRQSE